MSANGRSSFVYVTFIRTTPEKLWAALTDAEFTSRYWFGTSAQSAWTQGAQWKLVGRDGTLTDSGEIVESDPPRRLVIRWQNEWKAELKAEGQSRCTMLLEPVGSAVKLTVTHEIERAESKLITAVSGGWPRVLSNLKSLLETGDIAITEGQHHDLRARELAQAQASST